MSEVGSREFREREAQLAAEGWQRRNISDEPRLSELVELYRETGFEVRLEPLDPPALAGLDCSECMAAAPERYRILYVRPRRDEKEDLAAD